jgi:hypothetical protein
MPIVLNPADGTFVLRCVNNHHNPGPEPTTMRAVDAWLSLPGVREVRRPFLPGMSLPTPQLEQASLKVRYYYCHVCGYVEMYMANAANPVGRPGG